MLRCLGQSCQPATAYRRAIALRPEYWATHIWLGTFYRAQGRYADAAQQYELALALTPENARAYYVLCGLYGTGSVGRYDDAIAACRKSASLAPSVAAYSNWGATLANLRRFDEAVEKFVEARRIGPEDYRLDGNLARAYYFAGKRAEAMTLYKRAIALADEVLTINPRDTDARFSAAAYYAKSGDRARAVRELNRLPADVSDPHDLVFGAVIHVDLGDRAAALTWLERAAGHGLTAGELRDWIELDVLKDDPRFTGLRANER